MLGKLFSLFGSSSSTTCTTTTSEGDALAGLDEETRRRAEQQIRAKIAHENKPKKALKRAREQDEDESEEDVEEKEVEEEEEDEDEEVVVPHLANETALVDNGEEEGVEGNDEEKEKPAPSKKSVRKGGKHRWGKRGKKQWQKKAKRARTSDVGGESKEYMKKMMKELVKECIAELPDQKGKRPAKNTPTPIDGSVPSPSISFNATENSGTISDAGNTTESGNSKTTTESGNTGSGNTDSGNTSHSNNVTVTSAPQPVNKGKKVVMISYNVATMLEYIPALRSRLIANGFTPKECASNILPGMEFRAEISEWCDKCDYYICLVNAAWCKSKECHYETNYVIKRTLRTQRPYFYPVIIGKDTEGYLYDGMMANFQAKIVDMNGAEIDSWAGHVAGIVNTLIKHRDGVRA